jgi:hypothetical protein
VASMAAHAPLAQWCSSAETQRAARAAYPDWPELHAVPGAGAHFCGHPALSQIPILDQRANRPP